MRTLEGGIAIENLSDLKGNRHGKIFFLHFAFLSTPIPIDMCGKRLKLLVKYARSYG